MRDLYRIVEAVQHNCDIADARHAREMTMCNYLMGMREFYRWENELPFAQAISRDDVRGWLTQHEAKWGDLEEGELRPIPVEGQDLDPFDVAAVNRALLPHNLVYGAGVGRFGYPHFFLGDLARREQHAGLNVLVSGCEYARDMAAPPAALSQGTVFLRLDALQRWLWETIEIWGVHQPEGALKAALDCYGAGIAPEARLELMTRRESQTLLLHELGEAQADPILGEAWHDMLASFSGRRAELLARAVRDNLADCLSTIPELVQRYEVCSIHFYFANFEGLRAALFPGLFDAYQRWRDTRDGRFLLEAANAGRAHWLAAAQRLLELWAGRRQDAEAMIEEWTENTKELAL